LAALASLLGLGTVVGAAGAHARATDLERRLDAVETALAELGVLPAEVVGIIDRIEATLAEHGTSIEELRATATDLSSRLDRLADRLGRVEDTLDALSGQVEAHKGDITALRQAVSGELTSLGNKFYGIAALIRTPPFVRVIEPMAGLAGKFEAVGHELREMGRKVAPGSPEEGFACQVCQAWVTVIPGALTATCPSCGSVHKKVM